LRSPSSNIPSPSELSTRRANTCSEATPKTASMTAWVPHSISCSIRTFGNAPRPRVLLEAMNPCLLAGLSGTSSMVASQDTNRSPVRNAPGAPGRACAPRSRANKAASGATPTRRRACDSPGEDGVAASSVLLCVSSRHTPRYPCPLNRVNARTNHTTTRDGNRRTRCCSPPVSANTSSTSAAGTCCASTPNPIRRHTGTPTPAPAHVVAS
jgi:hypothetical protein